jgi:membrane protein DedA with SNARE-associated domain
MEFVLTWISQYGYPVLFAGLMLGIAGLPIPDETLLVFCGYLIATGRLQVHLTGLTAFSGSVAGISLSYLLGRTAGLTLINRYGRYLHVTPEHLNRVHSWFGRIGNWLLTFGYFIPGVRHFTALVAGMSKLEFWTFAIFAYAGAALWVTTFLSLGYVVGANWPTVMEILHRYTLLATGVLVVLVVVGYFVIARVRNRKRS